MMQEFEQKYGKQIPTWSGDFTPYWEDGAYSTAKEEGDVRVLSARLTNLIDAAKILDKPIDPHLLYRAKRSIVMWHEHTWGSWCSISDPEAHFTNDQWRVKQDFADSAGWYVEAIETGLLQQPPMTTEIVPFSTLPWPPGPVAKARFEEAESTPPRALNAPIRSDERLSRRDSLMMPSKGIGLCKIFLSPDYSMELSSFQRAIELEPGDWGRCFESVGYLGEIQYDFQGIPNKEAQDNIEFIRRYERRTGYLHVRFRLDVPKVRDKHSVHVPLPFNIPNATVRIGISDTCITPESGRIPGSNNDFFCAQRWIDVSNDSMGVTIVCPQGALWEVGEMVDELKVDPGKGTNPERYKAWKNEAHSSSTIYLYALNNYWHTNFKAEQPGRITFDLYLKMHGPFNLEEARRFGLEMTRPLITWWK